MTSTGPTRARRSVLARAVAGALVLLGTLTVVAAPATAADPPATQAPQSYLVADGDTGQIVAASNEHVPHLTASTIKILTAIVTLEHLPLDAPLTVSALAASQPAMRIDMKEGSVWPVDQALASLLMVSANDAAYAMAENTSGDLGRFSDLANATAKHLGMRDTQFHDPAGLDGAQGYGGGSLSSAYDLAIAARNALTVPAIAQDVTRLTYEFTDPSGAGRRLTNHNRGFLTGYPGAIGLKTGYTRAASRTLLAAARRGGRTCIAAIMGTWDDTGWAAYLLDRCFAGVRVAGAKPLPRPRVHLVSTPATPAASSPPGTTAPVEVVGATASRAATAPTHEAGTAPVVARTADAGATSGSGWSWGSIPRTAGLALVGLLVILVVLRRRTVKRRRARRIERMRAHAEARRRRMIDIIEPDDTGSDIRVVPGRTSHHVSAGRRRSDRRVVRATRPRDHRAPDRGA